jgi:hypothetical protein
MKNVTQYVNNGRKDSIVNIKKTENKYNARYVGQLPIRNGNRGWQSDDCAEIFWQDILPVEGYSHYFAIINRNGVLYITDGNSAAEGTISAVEAKNGEIIYSRYRHDMRYSTDNTVWIDGGRDYVRSGTTGRFLSLKIIDGEWFEVDSEEL